MAHAQAFIRAKLLNQVWQTGHRLPSLSRLAQLCTVSRTTVWKAVGLLQKEGLVHTTRGGPIYAGPIGAIAQESAETRGWRTLHHQLSKDLFAGTFSPGLLPPKAKLAAQYHATPRTVHKALSALAEDRLVVRDGLKYRVPTGSHPRRQLTMVLIVEGTANGLLSTEDPRTRAVADAFERECTRLGFAYRSIPFFCRNPQSLLNLKSKLQQLAGPIGFIVTLWDPWDKTIRTRWQDAVLLLARRDAPLIILDQAGGFELPENVAGHKNVRVLRIAGMKAGAQVAQYLVRQGHSHIAFITGSFAEGWVQDRYNGMVQFLNRYKEPHYTVDLFTFGEFSDQNILVLAMLGLQSKTIEPLYRERFNADEIANLKKIAADIAAGKIKPGMATTDLTKTLQFLAHAMARLAGRKHDVPAYASILDRILHIASDGAGDIFLQSHFHKVLKESAATVWVCSDEKAALSAVSYLAKAGKKVPSDIAVIGFENWREAYESQLSTYDFNMNGFIQRALQLIADEKAMARCPGMSEVEGYVVERATTRR